MAPLVLEQIFQQQHQLIVVLINSTFVMIQLIVITKVEFISMDDHGVLQLAASIECPVSADVAYQVQFCCI